MTRVGSFPHGSLAYLFVILVASVGMIIWRDLRRTLGGAWDAIIEPITLHWR